MGSFKVLLLLFTVAVVSWPMVAAQPPNFPNSQLQEPSVSPAMAIIIVVLVAALFFVAFFSIYVRHRNSGESIGQTLSMRRRNTVAAARGFEASVIEATFPTFTYAEVKDHHIGKGALECAVCLNEFEDAEMLRLIPKCDHVFHPECIDAWLKSHVTCPVCRADLTTTDPQPDQVSEAIVSPEEEQQRQSGNLQQNSSDEVSIRIESDENPSQQLENQPEVKRNLSSKLRSFSIKWPKKFRSHSTGHSLVVPGENLDRYTLRLPENVRKEVMNRALLNRAKSCAATLPRYGSSRRGYRSGSIGRSFRRIERSDQEPKSDRWVFKMAPPFFTRGPSMKSPKVVDESGEGSTSQSVKTVTKMPSFRCLEPRDDEPGLLTDDSAKNPV